MLLKPGNPGLEARLNRRLLLGGAAAAAAARLSPTSAAPRSQQTATGTPTQGGSIIMGALGEAQTINPIVAGENQSDFRCSLIFEQLIRLDPTTYEPKPSLAQGWDLKDLTYTFTLHPDIKFSDGSPCTADDVSFTMLAMADPKNACPRQSIFQAVEGAGDFAADKAATVSGIKVVNPTTLAVTLQEPDASFLPNMYWIHPLPKALLAGKDVSKASTEAFFQNPIGAGPFRFVSWSVGGDFVGERNQYYYQKGKPYLDKFTHRVIPDAQSLVNAMLSGDIDGSVDANPAGADQLRKAGNLNVMVPPFPAPDGWIFNFSNEYLAKKEVRQAVAYALDMTQFAKDSLFGLGAPATGPIAPGNFAYDSSLKPHPYDMAKAKELLDQAGPPPDGIEFAINQGNQLRQDFLIYTQAQLAQLGWNIAPVVGEYAALVDRALNHRFTIMDSQMVGAGATVDLTDLDRYYSTHGSANYCGYSNPDLDKLLTAARQSLDLEKQKELYRQIQQILVEDIPATWSWYRPYIHVIKNSFAGYVDSQLSNGPFAELENVYVAAK
jgi:peptide/nickel transport system substrate-binding protein